MGCCDMGCGCGSMNTGCGGGGCGGCGSSGVGGVITSPVTMPPATTPAEPIKKLPKDAAEKKEAHIQAPADPLLTPTTSKTIETGTSNNPF
jgi:hypothetical protein